jgi:hypothetical protein
MATAPYRICHHCNQLNDSKARQCERCGQPMPDKVDIFISYSHSDRALLDDLKKHLSILKRTGLGLVWTDQDIDKGAEWSPEILKHLDKADMILLLISADFLASDFCYDKEMTRAMERHKRGEACVIPVILRPCPWTKTPFARLQALPLDGQPVSTARNKDQAFLEITQGIQGVIKKRFGLEPPKDNSW